MEFRAHVVPHVSHQVACERAAERSCDDTCEASSVHVFVSREREQEADVVCAYVRMCNVVLPNSLPVGGLPEAFEEGSAACAQGGADQFAREYLVGHIHKYCFC